jgi:hypothetical protein
MPAQIEIQPLKAANITAVQIEETRLSGRPFFVVSVMERPGKAPYRRWYPTEADALAYAAETADRRGLLLIDLREGEPE